MEEKRFLFGAGGGGHPLNSPLVSEGLKVRIIKIRLSSFPDLERSLLYFLAGVNN